MDRALAGTGRGHQHRAPQGQPIRFKVGHGRLEVPRASHSEHRDQEWGAVTRAVERCAAVAALKVAFEAGGGKGRVFKSKKTGDPLENGRHWFDDAIVLAKLRNFHWHDLRHTFASRLRMKGAPLEDIADLLGHKSLTMTRRYAHLGPNKLHAVVSLLGSSDTTSDTSQNTVSAAVLQAIAK